MYGFTLVLVGMAFTSTGGPSVTTRADPMPTEASCRHHLAEAQQWYATNRPQARILYADCVLAKPVQAPAAQPPAVIREWVYPQGVAPRQSVPVPLPAHPGYLPSPDVGQRHHHHWR